MVCTSPFILYSPREAELYWNFAFQIVLFCFGSIILFYNCYSHKDTENMPSLCFEL